MLILAYYTKIIKFILLILLYESIFSIAQIKIYNKNLNIFNKCSSFYVIIYRVEYNYIILQRRYL
nr:MAG TPA: hypothetical protein [Caudoviricetes sp.]